MPGSLCAFPGSLKSLPTEHLLTSLGTLLHLWHLLTVVGVRWYGEVEVLVSFLHCPELPKVRVCDTVPSIGVQVAGGDLPPLYRRLPLLF